MSDFQRPTQPPHSDEIDIRSFFRSIRRGLASLGRRFVALLALIRRTSVRHKGMLITLFLIGIAIGVGFSFIKKDTYSSSIMLRSSLFTPRVITSLVSRLDEMADRPRQLAAELNISPEEAATIRGFSVQAVFEPVSLEFQNLVKKRLRSDIEEDPSLTDNIEAMTTGDTYLIYVTATNVEVIRSLDQQLPAFFQRSPYFSKRMALLKRQEQQLAQRLEKDLASLDSLKSAIIASIRNTPAGQGAGFVLTDNRIDETRYSTLFQDADYLYRKKLQADLAAEVPAIEVIQPFGNYAPLFSVSKPVYALLGGIIFLAIGYLLLLLKGLNRYLIRYDQKRNNPA
ncbi:hypothetical protein AB9P05_09640 [Roseivirga sp. BDSF3-8]|uniref:hypothetical protein n=1 Tax=Roseivirga sp. BDSF3-8 TaxID=3241598 RepID=UPI003531E0BB